MKLKALAFAVSSIIATSAFAQKPDFGQRIEALAKAQSRKLFGTLGTLNESSSASVDAATAEADPRTLVTVAPGLRVKVVSAASNLGANTDMMVLWPNDSAPTHLIACNEQNASKVGVQRIRLSDGLVEDIISSGLTSCDPAEITPWGTVVVAEEAGSNGRLFEILDPLNTTGVTVSGSGLSTTTSDPAHVAHRPALGQLSYESVAIYPNGVVYYGDEKRPTNGNLGGSFFKFIPATPWAAGSPPITDLAHSPLTNGHVFGLRLGKRSDNTDFGPGNQTGRGVWVEVVDGQVIGSTTVNRIDLAAAATALKLTAYYRPEDIDIDPKARAAGNVRFCGANTGEDSPNGSRNYGEVFCITDGTIAEAAAINTTTQTTDGATYTLNAGPGTTIPEYQPLVIPYFDFGMPDNVAYQPGTGNWLIHEDGEGPEYSPPRNNDIWSCLDDGADRDGLSDSCAKLITLNDLTAEPTGGVFDATGKRFFVSIQHNVTGHGVVLEITGWR